MKKFSYAILAAAAVATSAFAGESKTGAYVGGNLGGANTSDKFAINNYGSTATASGAGNQTTGQAISAYTTNATARNTEAGKFNPLFGLFAGYGMQVGSMYFGGEVYGGFDSAKVQAMNEEGTGFINTSGQTQNFAYGKAQVKRTAFYGLAPRLGFLVNPNTVLYVKLAIEAGKWEAKYTFATNDTGAKGASVTAKKNSIAFAPAIGMDAFLSKNLFLRAEYSYLFGPKISQKIDTNSSNAWGGTFANATHQVTQQAFKVGVGFKF